MATNTAPKKPAEKSAEKSTATYIVLTPLRHGVLDAKNTLVSTTYDVGDQVELDDDTAARLLAERAVSRTAAAAPAKADE